MNILATFRTPMERQSAEAVYILEQQKKVDICINSRSENAFIKVNRQGGRLERERKDIIKGPLARILSKKERKIRRNPVIIKDLCVRSSVPNNSNNSNNPNKSNSPTNSNNSNSNNSNNSNKPKNNSITPTNNEITPTKEPITPTINSEIHQGISTRAMKKAEKVAAENNQIQLKKGVLTRAMKKAKKLAAESDQTQSKKKEL